MKETGIIMSGNHPKLVMDGIKTQTRRVILPQPHEEEYLEVGKYTPALVDKDGEQYPADFEVFGASTLDGEIAWKCPYGQVGDRLYCRENYYILDEYLLGESDILYRLTDDRIFAILTTEVQDGRYKTDEWSPSQSYPNLPQRGLHGGVGWSSLLTNKIQRLWAEGIRGLVSAQRTCDRQGIHGDNDEPREQQGFQDCSPINMYGFS